MSKAKCIGKNKHKYIEFLFPLYNKIYQANLMFFVELYKCIFNNL